MKFKSFDRQVVEVAVKYAGILTLTAITYELKISLEEAQSALDRFVRFGEARRIQIGSMSVYDIPTARTQITNLQNRLIETFLGESRRLSKPILVSRTKVNLEAIDEALGDLERKGIIVRDSQGFYRLRLLS